MEINKAHILLEHFSETVDQWVGCLDDYTLEMLCQKPAPDSWSLGQVYVHIISDTTWFVEQIRISLSSTANNEKEMNEAGREMLKNNAFPDMQLIGPSTVTSVKQPESKEELSEGLMAIKDEINKVFFASDPSASIGKTQHPGFQFLNALEWLQFAEMHMRHHFRQKKRIDDKLFSHKNGKSYI